MEEYTGFKFAKEPKDAAEMLKDYSDGEATIALNLVMNQASESPVPECEINPHAITGDAYEAEKYKKTDESDRPFDESDIPFDEKGADRGVVTAVEESSKKVTKDGDKPVSRSTAPGMNGEGANKGKASQEMVGEVGVSCCCSFW
jgi:hypothetical protein